MTIGLTSAGTLDLTNSPVGSADETVLLQQGGFGPLATLHLDFINTVLPVAGTGTYTGAGGTLDFSYSWTSTSSAGFAQAVIGTWLFTGGTGTYANVVSGSGTITTNINFATPTPYDSFTTFRGDLQAVPEPATLAAVGVGAVAMLRRRRRSA